MGASMMEKASTPSTPFDIVAMVLHLKVSAHTTMEDIGEISVLYCVKIFFIEDKELNGISVQAL